MPENTVESQKLEVTREGGCSCSRHRFCCIATPKTVFACHCKECQKMSGSAFLVWLEYRPEEVKLNLRELKHYSRKGASGNRVNFFFCGACGSTICGTMEGRPSLFLTAGVFDETDWIFPGAHLWKGSAQKWLQRSAGTLDVF